MREIRCPSLAERTTIRLGGNALAELVLDDPADLAPAFRLISGQGASPLILGAGSNILAADGELPYIILRPRFMCGPDLAGEDTGRILVRAGAGVPLARLLRFCISHGLGGLEGLVGIPGTVGGAVAMNAGSFGVSAGECLHSLTVFSRGCLREYRAGEFSFGYRHFALAQEPDGFIIVDATFGLTSSCRNVIFKLINRDFVTKKSRQPVLSRSAGCVFKNPTDALPAGKLLDAAGFRGRRNGGMAFSPVHANFLVNDGSGTSAEAFELVNAAKESVYRLFGIELQPEVRIVKCPSR